MASDTSNRTDWASAPVAIVALSAQEAKIGGFLLQHLSNARLYVPEKLAFSLASPCAPFSVAPSIDIREVLRFERVADCIKGLFGSIHGIIGVAPLGVIVRSIAACLESKHTDPAVVVVDAVGRHAISVLSGHEGGANRLAYLVSEILNATPIITTTTEATKRVVVGIGCRRHADEADIRESILSGLRAVERTIEDVRLLATVDVKRDEASLRIAASKLNLPIKFVSLAELNRFECSESPVVRAAIGAPAVAFPAALIAGVRTRCLLNKTVFRPAVTIAIAEEQLPWSALDPEPRTIEPAAPNVTC